jgi:hypothetical protein
VIKFTRSVLFTRSSFFNHHPLKKLFSILFLFLFLLFQYGRISNYPQCPLLPSSGGATVICDCEKQQVADSPGNKDVPGTERSVSKSRPDEVFSGSALPTVARRITDLLKGRPALGLNLVPAGYATSIFQPPRL